mgnify:CR=1 FL=1
MISKHSNLIVISDEIYEHINFTYRCIYHKMIPYAIDIKNPFKYIDHIGFEPVGYNKFVLCLSVNGETG